MNYFLTGIDKHWWKKIKLHALRRDMSIKDLIIYCLAKELREYDLIVNHDED